MKKWSVTVERQMRWHFDDIEADTKGEAIEQAEQWALDEPSTANMDSFSSEASEDEPVELAPTQGKEERQ